MLHRAVSGMKGRVAREREFESRTVLYTRAEMEVVESALADVLRGGFQAKEFLMNATRNSKAISFLWAICVLLVGGGLFAEEAKPQFLSHPPMRPLPAAAKTPLGDGPAF